MKKQRFHGTKIAITGGELKRLLREEFFDGGTGLLTIDISLNDNGEAKDVLMNYTTENIDK